MIFTTPTFLVFLVIAYGLYWVRTDRRWQNSIILVASLVFYAWWDWRFLFMLLAISGIDFGIGLGLGTTQGRVKRKWLLAGSLASNLAALGFFKYFNFFSASLHDALQALGFSVSPVTLQVILPVGISFYTFQALSYTIDVYRGRMHVVRNFLDYFCFIIFFPHMVAGPIQQAKHLLVQFQNDRIFDRAESTDGLRQMLWGFFKKMVVSDNLGPLVTAAYSDVQSVSGWQLLWATYYFAIQIYCDFSGYTDIAIGCAKIFGLNMTRNFAYPYFARNIKEFWQRWHISLTTWFREYLYIPLGGNRLGRLRTAANVFIVFVVSGLWHGANWTFVVWGALHGFYYLVYTQLVSPAGGPAPRSNGGVASRCARGLGTLVTFHLVLLAWVFFRADNVSAAWSILCKVGAAPLAESFTGPSMKLVLLSALVFGAEWIQRQEPHALNIKKFPRPLRWAVYYAVVLAILFVSHVGETPFIYFQF